MNGMYSTDIAQKFSNICVTESNSTYSTSSIENTSLSLKDKMKERTLLLSKYFELLGLGFVNTKSIQMFILMIIIPYPIHLIT